MAHLRDAWHEKPANSEIATAAYLTAVCHTLQASQKMHNRIHAAESTLADLSAENSVLTLASEQLGISKQLLINHSSASSGTNGAKLKWPSAPSRPAKQARAPQPSALSPEQKEKLERRRPASQRLEVFCSTLGLPRSLNKRISLFAADIVLSVRAKPMQRVPFSALISHPNSIQRCWSGSSPATGQVKSA
jgi:hypothetical protein